jgi:hypothetical protein
VVALPPRRGQPPTPLVISQPVPSRRTLPDFGIAVASGRGRWWCGWRPRLSHREVRVRVAHAFARMKAWRILRYCRLKGDGVRYAILGIGRLHSLTLAG